MNKNKMNKTQVFILVILIIATLITIIYFFFSEREDNLNNIDGIKISNINTNQSIENTEIIEKIEENQKTTDAIISNDQGNNIYKNNENTTNENEKKIEKKNIEISEKSEVFETKKAFKNANDYEKKTTYNTEINEIKKNKNEKIIEKKEEIKKESIKGKITSAEETNNVKVFFKTNGGNTMATVYIKENSKVSRPVETPIKENSIFIDWFSDRNLQNIYNFDTPVSQDITLYAGWRAEVDTLISHAVDKFKLSNTSISKNGNQVIVYFSKSNFDILDMESSLTKLFKNASNNEKFQNVNITYNGKGFDYLNYTYKVEPLRFIGWFGKNNWSGSSGLDCTSGDFINKTFCIEIKLKNGYLSENNNSSETYSISFKKV